MSDTIEAEMTFTIDTGVKPVAATYGPGGRLRHREGTFETRPVEIINGRPQIDRFSLETEGFALVPHDTRVKNFYDEDELKSVYYPEMEQLISQMTGATRVVVFDHTLRHGDEQTREKDLLREPVRMVHNDYTEWSGPERARHVFGEEEAEKLLKHRMAVIQVWRAINTDIERDPLAIADARSLTPDELIASERRHLDRVGEIYQIAYSPQLKWYYFPKMRRNEALVFKCYDSEKDGRARFTAHSSFKDPTTPKGARPRESIEIRTLAFFENDG